MILFFHSLRLFEYSNVVSKTTLILLKIKENSQNDNFESPTDNWFADFSAFDHFVDIRILSHFYYTLANYLAFYELAI